MWGHQLQTMITKFNTGKKCAIFYCQDWTKHPGQKERS